MLIQTRYDPTPIPDRRFDWSAIDADSYDGAPDAGPRASAIGHGQTEAQAVADLLAKFRELHSEAYNLGCDARNDFAARIAPDELDWNEQADWLAGWDAANCGFETKSEG